MSMYKSFSELSREEQIELFNDWLDGKKIECNVGDGVWKEGLPTGFDCYFCGSYFYRVASTKPSIDWNAVHPDYKWLATGSDNEGRLYKEKPKVVKWAGGAAGCYTTTLSNHIPAKYFASFIPGDCYWEDSLVKRPEVEA